MDQVFAPWRIEWVEREHTADSECVFCTFATGENDRENRVVARSEHAYVLLNNYPYSPGHLMVIPAVHTGSLPALSEPVLLEQAKLQQRSMQALNAAFDPDGFNTGRNLGEGAGGSISEHLHTHIVPRWEGDTNFMPVIGDTKVIVEALSDSFDRLHAAFLEQDGTRQSDTGAVEVTL